VSVRGTAAEDPGADRNQQLETDRSPQKQNGSITEQKSLSLSLSTHFKKKNKHRILCATMTRRNEEHEADERPWDADDRSQYYF
jgi:hypothetical protein